MSDLVEYSAIENIQKNKHVKKQMIVCTILAINSFCCASSLSVEMIFVVPLLLILSILLIPYLNMQAAPSPLLYVKNRIICL